MLTLLALAAIAAATSAGVPAHVTPDAIVWRARPANVTVLSGSVAVDGYTFPAGSYFTITPFAGDLAATEESVIQVTGDGPWLKGAFEAAPPVEAMFESTRAGMTIGVPKTTTGPQYPLTAASGEMTIEVPLELVIAHENIAKPLRMWIFLLRKTGEKSTRPVARTPTVVLNVK